MWFLHKLISRPVVRAYSRAILDRTYKVSRLMRLLSWVEFKLRPFKPTRLELFLWVLPWKMWLVWRDILWRTRTGKWIRRWCDLNLIIWLGSPDGNSDRTLVFYPGGYRNYESRIVLKRWSKRHKRLEQFLSDYLGMEPEW